MADNYSPLTDFFRKEGWETRIAFIDEYYVHIDLMVVPIAEKLTAVCRACTEPNIVAWLEAKGHEIVDVPFEDTINLGCNFKSLGQAAHTCGSPRGSRPAATSLPSR
jgi:N-dimethylarginine dimethylaminohydrolase